VCGIVGILDLQRRPVSRETVRRMNDQIVHRGPDGEGYWVEGSVGLAMRRLAIIDLAGGQQPMRNEDGTIVLVYNGEIYNFKQLRKELVARGHTLHTQSDTEVIPHLYEERGVDFTDALNGMFAIALWDDNRRELVLARDRLGIKPLYYTEHDGRIMFGSELKSLVAAGIDLEISREAVYHYLTYGYVPAPFTCYERVFKLLPGHTAICSEAGIEIRRYWDVKPSPDPEPSAEVWLERLDDLLLDAVRSQMISDVPLGAFLSGGLDSSLVVAQMSRCSDRPVRTFTIRFDEDSHNEAHYARAVADRFGTDHTDLVVTPKVADHFERIIRQFDEPFADASAIPTYFVSELTRQHVTVALSGDGADEVFGGYHRYTQYFRKRRLYRIPRVLRQHVLAGIGGRLPDGVRGKRFLRSMRLDPRSDYVVGDDEISGRALLSSEFLSPSVCHDTMDISGPHINANYPSELDALCMHDLNLYLPDDILTKVDRMSMAVSLEVRVPFLDHRVVEMGFSMPANLRLRGNTGKYLLKQLLSRTMGDEHVHRKKMGFAVPLGQWFRGELRELLNDSLHETEIRRVGIFDPTTVGRMLKMHLSGRRNFEARIWRVLVAQLWARHRRSFSI